ncbi:MAG: hypothetical protein ACE15D_02455 [Candidatus Eisenbacteria bacterium]
MTAALLSLALAFALALGPSDAGAQSRLILTEYQYNNPKIRSMNLDGSDAQLLFSPPTSEWLPLACDVDPSLPKLYWTNGNYTSGTIRRANFDGTASQLLLSGLRLPRGLSLDLDAGKLYFADSPPQGTASGLIRRANLDGTGLETVFAADPYDPNFSYVGPPTADATNGYVYFCAEDAIRRIRMDGTGGVETVVRGVNTVTSIALDAAAGRIYFLDANTNSDVLCRANLDDTGFTVLVDMSPGEGVSSGLISLRIDPERGQAWWTDELAGAVRRANLDGTGVETIYNSPAGLSPAGISFDVPVVQGITDCNGNGVRDLDDVVGGVSEDCNGNGVPDECEDDPCRPIDWIVDNGSDTVTLSRTLSGDPATGYEIFQPFDLTEPTVARRIDLDGWTINWQVDGFRATLYPDDGTNGFPDLDQPIAWADYQYRFSPDSVAWVSQAWNAPLEPGRWWLRLSANDPAYDAGANVGVRGPHCIMRRLSDLTLIYPNYSIAMKIEGQDPAGAPEQEAAGGGAGGGRDGWSALALEAHPNPMRDSAELSFTMPAGSSFDLAVYDASGRKVRGLIAAGNGGAATVGHVAWDGRDDAGRTVPAGYYVLRLEATSSLGGAARVIRRPIVRIR